jgi:hypothetical protein
MEYIKNLKGETWKQYKDTPYYVSNYGRFKRRWADKEVLANGWTRYLKKSKGNLKGMFVKIYRKEMSLPRLVWETFMGEIPNGYVIHHKDNCFTNNDLNNLELITYQECGKKTGGRVSKRRLIYCADNDKIYKGIKQASEDLFVSRQTITDICNGKRKKEPVVNVRWFYE